MIVGGNTRGLAVLAALAGLGVGVSIVPAEQGGRGEPLPPAPRKGRMPLQLPATSADHFTSERPLTKRAKRRQRGKAKS